MTRNHLLSLILVQLIAWLNPMMEFDSMRSENKSLVVVGTVIAYDQLLPLINITSAPQSQVLLVRIEKRIKGRESAVYVKVVYEYGGDEPSLPKGIFDGKSQWRFLLKRDGRCDSSLREMKAGKPQSKEGEEVTLPHLKFTDETEVLADDTNLPCYVLKPGNYRAQK
jgi:hypothetical protein